MKYLLFIFGLYAIGGLVYAASIRQPIRIQNAVSVTTTTTQGAWVDTMTHTFLLDYGTNAYAALDNSGNNINCTNYPTMATGVAFTYYTNFLGMTNDTLTFDGSSTYMQNYPCTNFWKGSQLTLSAWVKMVKTVGAGEQEIVARDHYQLGKEWRLGVSDQGGIITHVNESFAYGSNGIPSNTWTLLTTIWDGTNINVYTNAVKCNITNYPYSTPLSGSGNNAMEIGFVWYGSLANRFKGTMDFVCADNKAWSQDYLNQVYLYTHPTNNMRQR